MVRHIRHKHPTVACAAGVSKLDAVSAAATLADYMNTWARKKFVLNSRRRRCRPRSPAQQGSATTDNVSVLSPHRSCAAVQPVTPSSINRVQFAPPEVVSGESPKTFGSEDRLVIDTADYDDSCEAASGKCDRRDADEPTLSSSNWSSSSEAVAEMSRCPLTTCRSCDRGDCIHDRQEARIAADANAAGKTQSVDRDRRRMCECPDRWDSGRSSSTSLSRRRVDERSSSAASCYMITVGLQETVTVNSQKTDKPNSARAQPAAVTDAFRRDISAANESSSLDDDVSSEQLWSSAATEVKKRLFDGVEERSPAEQHVDRESRRQRPLQDTKQSY